MTTSIVLNDELAVSDAASQDIGLRGVNHDSSSPDTWPWAVAILSSRESPVELMASINALACAVTKRARIDVLVNGNASLAKAIAEWCAAQRDIPALSSLRIWYITLGDKANTWNWYVHAIWPGAETTYFIDGYVQVAPAALALLDKDLSDNAKALAASGVPGCGRSAEQYKNLALRDGGLHGNLYAFKRSVMDELRIRRIRLPLGLYGYDALVGAMIAFALDPTKNAWDAKGRIIFDERVTWIYREMNWWAKSDAITHARRILKQTLRILVNQAIRDFLVVQKRLPEELPPTLAALVLEWSRNHSEELRRTIMRSPLSWWALRKLNIKRDWSAAEISPELLFSSAMESFHP